MAEYLVREGGKGKTKISDMSRISPWCKTDGLFEMVYRGNVIWKGEWTASSKIKRGNEYIMEVDSSKPLSQADGIGLVCRPSRLHGASAIIIINRLVVRCCLLALIAGRVLVDCVIVLGRKRSEPCSLSAPTQRLLCVRVCRSDCHAYSVKGGRLTVTPGRSDRVVYGKIVGTQRARDPTKHVAEEEANVEAEAEALNNLELELELDPFCSPQSANRRASRLSLSSFAGDELYFSDWPSARH